MTVCDTLWRLYRIQDCQVHLNTGVNSLNINFCLCPKNKSLLKCDGMFCLNFNDCFKHALAVLPCPFIRSVFGLFVVFCCLAHKAMQFMDLLKWAGVGYSISGLKKFSIWIYLCSVFFWVFFSMCISIHH